MVPMSTAGIGKRRHGGRDGDRRNGRQIALHVDDDVVASVGIDRRQRLENAIGAGHMIGARHYGAARRGLNGVGHVARIGRDHDGTNIRLGGAPQHLHDHRHPADIGEGLAGQARGSHAGRDEDDRAGHRTRESGKK